MLLAAMQAGNKPFVLWIDGESHMADEEVIAKRYARGLAEYAVQAKEIDAVRHDLKIVAGLIDPQAGSTYVPEFAAYLGSPSLKVDDKKKVVADMMKKAGVASAVTDFLGVLLERGRIPLLPKIARAFGPVSAELTGEHTAVIQTAHPLTKDQESRLRQVLASAYGGTIHIHQLVEPSLLSGARITVGDQTFDGSALGKLDAIRRRLAVGDVFIPASESMS